MSQTNRTIREGSQWVKVTRDSKARTFTFARGDAGVMKANDIRTYPFAFVPTWADAEGLAKSNMATFQ